MCPKVPQGADLKALYLNALGQMATNREFLLGTYNAQGSGNDGKRWKVAQQTLEKLIASMEGMSENHQLLNDPMLVPFVPMRGNKGKIIWIVTDSRFMQAATANDWTTAEEWLTAALCHCDYLA